MTKRISCASSSSLSRNEVQNVGIIRSDGYGCSAALVHLQLFFQEKLLKSFDFGIVKSRNISNFRLNFEKASSVIEQRVSFSRKQSINRVLPLFRRTRRTKIDVEVKSVTEQPLFCHILYTAAGAAHAQTVVNVQKDFPEPAKTRRQSIMGEEMVYDRTLPPFPFLSWFLLSTVLISCNNAHLLDFTALLWY